MKLILNIVLVCHLLESCISYLINGGMNNPHGYMHNRLQRENSPNYDSDESLSYSEGRQSRHRNPYKHNHVHLRRPMSYSERISPLCGSRRKCHRGYNKNKDKSNEFPFPQPYLPPFPAPFPPPFPPPFPQPFPPPDVIVVPYPVPIMVMSRVLTISPSSLKPSVPPTTVQTTPSTSQAPPTTQTQQTTTSITTPTPETITLTTSTLPPAELRTDIFGLRRPKRFKIMTIKTYRRKESNPAQKSSIRTFPKYGIVRIPEDLAIRLMQKLEKDRERINNKP